MANTLKIKRGLKANLPTLTDGELGYCKDTNEVYIGNGTANVKVGSAGSATGVAEIEYVPNTFTTIQSWALSKEGNFNGFLYENHPIVESTTGGMPLSLADYCFAEVTAEFGFMKLVVSYISCQKEFICYYLDCDTWTPWQNANFAKRGTLAEGATLNDKLEDALYNIVSPTGTGPVGAPHTGAWGQVRVYNEGGYTTQEYTQQQGYCKAFRTYDTSGANWTNWSFMNVHLGIITSITGDKNITNIYNAISNRATKYPYTCRIGPDVAIKLDLPSNWYNISYVPDSNNTTGWGTQTAEVFGSFIGSRPTYQRNSNDTQWLAWQYIPRVIVSSTLPSYAYTTDVWIDTENKLTKYWNGSAWCSVGSAYT